MSAVCLASQPPSQFTPWTEREREGSEGWGHILELKALPTTPTLLSGFVCGSRWPLACLLPRSRPLFLWSISFSAKRASQIDSSRGQSRSRPQSQTQQQEQILRLWHWLWLWQWQSLSTDRKRGSGNATSYLWLPKIQWSVDACFWLGQLLSSANCSLWIASGSGSTAQWV